MFVYDVLNMMRLSKVVFAFCLVLGTTALKMRDDNQVEEATDAKREQATVAKATVDKATVAGADGCPDTECMGYDGTCQSYQPVYDANGPEGDYSNDGDQVCDTACGRFDGNCHDTGHLNDDHRCFYMCTEQHRADVMNLHAATAAAAAIAANQRVADLDAEIAENAVQDGNDVHVAIAEAKAAAAYEIQAAAEKAAAAEQD